MTLVKSHDDTVVILMTTEEAQEYALAVLNNVPPTSMFKTAVRLAGEIDQFLNPGKAPDEESARVE